jgi:uncharacterized repeat protein (TIGR03837 family)
MRWDIFCTVIDNFGDVGVCWRLARDLAARGHTCRLWLDDASALRWMAPEVDASGAGHPGVQVLPWPTPQALLPDDMTPDTTPGDVVIEAFGCNPPEAFVARMQRPHPPVWINLEYLSAEGYVERSHGLPSPVMSGPGAGLRKWFYYPGFTERTGGLLREPGLLARRDALHGSPQVRADALARMGVAWQPGERVVSVFCYPQAPVGPLLDQLLALANTDTSDSPAPVCHVLFTPGAASQAAAHWSPNRSSNRSPNSHPGPLLQLHALPPLPQPDFDTLLWASDLNIVRGEDSAVRALWAGQPHIWHIYPQADGAHAAKLEAFMACWMADWPAELRDRVGHLWRTFNGLSPLGHQAGVPPPDLPALTELKELNDLMQGPAWAQWRAASRQSSQKLATQPDLAAQLLHFVMNPG